MNFLLLAPRPFLLGIVLIFCGLGCTSRESPAPNGTADSLRKVKLALNWFPEAEHGGFYAAQLNGHFAAEGLAVEIIPGGPDSPVVPQVARGAIEFGVANADQVPLGRAQGANVVATFAAIDQSPRCILVHEESGIKSLQELKDVTLAVTSGRAFAEYLKAKVPLKNVREVPYDGSVAPFLRDKKFTQQAYEFSEPFLAEEQGANVRVLPIREIGYNIYTSMLITSDRTLRENPEIVGAMNRACKKGWRDYLQDPAAVNAHLRKLNPELTPGVLEFGVEAIRPLTTFEQEDFGQMQLDRWQTLVEQLTELGMLAKGKVSAEACFTNLEEAP